MKAACTSTRPFSRLCCGTSSDQPRLSSTISVKDSLQDIDDPVEPGSRLAVWIPVLLVLAAGLMLLTMRWNHLPLMLPFMLVIAAPFIRFFISPKPQRPASRSR